MAFDPENQPDPLRLKVLKAITASMLEITIGNEYYFDLGPVTTGPEQWPDGKVFRGRVKYGEGDPLPMLSILEAPIPKEPMKSLGANSVGGADWELLIQGFVEDDPKHPTDPGHLFMAEVKRRLAYEKNRDRGRNCFGIPEIADMTIGQGAVRPADDPQEKAFFWLTLTLKLAESWEKPYGVN